MWIKKTYLFTKESFPTFFRRSEIIRTVSIELSPIENAIKIIKDKNKQLSNIAETTKQKNTYSGQFTMALNGVIDAAVAGGVSQLADVFFSADFILAHPDKAEYVRKLRFVLETQCGILEEALRFHKTIVPEKMIGLHKKLEGKKF